MRRLLITLTAVVTLAAIMVQPALAASGAEFPAKITLPASFYPDGMAVDPGGNFYLNSSSTGAIYRGSLRTGEGQILIQPAAGQTSAALRVDPRTDYLFVAGGAGGQAIVYDAESGAQIASYQLAPRGGYLNDLVITRSAAYFTDCAQPYFYRLPLGPGGELPAPAAVSQILLVRNTPVAYVAPNSVVSTGGATSLAYVAPNSVVATEGAMPLAYVAPNSVMSSCSRIEATPDGKWLVFLNTTTGEILRVDPATGAATAIDLGGGVKLAGSMALMGRDLYIVQTSGQIATYRLNEDLSAGSLEQVLTGAGNAALRVPGQAAAFEDSLYVVDTPYFIVPAAQPGPGAGFAVVRAVAKASNLTTARASAH